MVRRFRALDFFAGDGGMLSRGLLRGMDVVAFDVDGGLLGRYVLPAERRVGDSFELARDPGLVGGFDYVLVDNTAGLFGGSWVHCEHFEALPVVLPLLRGVGVVSFNVVTSPLFFTLARFARSWRCFPGAVGLVVGRVLSGYYAEWVRRRAAFYGGGCLLGVGGFLGFYRGFFAGRGYRVLGVSWRMRLPGLYLVTFRLCRCS